ncbi:MAG: hypothetical protein COB60_12930 [Flavobacteriaceae bacterium]|nr:MAG: hypothetical protein COB60_12930 [Flavobacteriaceae bacterium]
MKSTLLTLLTLVLIFTGCEQRKKENGSESFNEIVALSTPKKVLKTPNRLLEEKSETQTIKEHQLHIKFREFELILPNISVWDEEEKLKEIQNDTATIYLELGASIEGKSIKIKKIKEGTLKIYQRYENSVTIMNEGPHCDLINWKHYDSPWEELKVVNGAFNTQKYTETDREQFISIDLKELKAAVNEHCGENWLEHIKDVTSPTEYPCGVSTSTLFLKVEINNETERIISFEIPMGC